MSDQTLRQDVERLADECDQRIAKSPDRVLQFWNNRLRALLDKHRDERPSPERVAQAVERLASRAPDGDEVVRVTISPIPGVGLGQRTSTYVSVDALRALLAEHRDERPNRCPGCGHTCCPYPGLECGGDSDRVRGCERPTPKPPSDVTTEHIARLYYEGLGWEWDEIEPADQVECVESFEPILAAFHVTPKNHTTEKEQP